MKALYDLKEKFHIDINIDKDRGMTFLYGTKDEISAASDVYHKIIRDAERDIQDGLQAKLISDYVQWYYVDNSDGKNELIEYSDNINVIIEKAYRNQDKEVKFRDKGTEYAINLNNMKKYPTVDRSDVTTVIRRDNIKGIYHQIMIIFFDLKHHNDRKYYKFQERVTVQDSIVKTRKFDLFFFMCKLNCQGIFSNKFQCLVIFCSYKKNLKHSFFYWSLNVFLLELIVDNDLLHV